MTNPQTNYPLAEQGDLNESWPKPMLWTELEAKKFPEEQWLIKHLIPAGGIVNIAAPSTEMKSWIAMEMARCIALGINYLGFDGFTTIAGNILYIDQENSLRELQRRTKQLGFSNSNKNIWFVNRNELNLNSDVMYTWLEEFVQKNDIKAVFIDTLSAVAIGLEMDKVQEVRPFFNRFKALKEIGVAIIFIDHTRKQNINEGNKPNKDQVLGSQDKVASVEILIMLKRKQNSNELIVYQMKNRLNRELKPFVITIEDKEGPNGEITTTISYSGEHEEDKLKIEEAKEIILKKLEDGISTRKALINYVKQTKAIGQRNTSDAIRQLVTEEKIVPGQLGRQKTYKLPDTEETSNEQIPF